MHDSIELSILCVVKSKGEHMLSLLLNEHTPMTKKIYQFPVVLSLFELSKSSIYSRLLIPEYTILKQQIKKRSQMGLWTEIYEHVLYNIEVDFW